jgi:glucokinase
MQEGGAVQTGPDGLNTKDALILGIDFGGTKILSAVADRNGNIFGSDYRKTPADQGPEGVVEEVIRSARATLNTLSLTPSQISAIGVAAPGLVNPDSGIVHTSPNLAGWKDVPVRDMIRERLGPETFLLNDGNAGTLAEATLGAARGVSECVYVALGTGIGGGIVIRGEIYEGSRGWAGEIGHMAIDMDGPLCRCGARGCWEALASGSALERQMKRRLVEDSGRERLSFPEHPGKVSARSIYLAALNGDALAAELIAETGRYLGVGFANLINIFNPEMMVIGGGLSTMGDLLLAPAVEEAKKRAFRRSFHAVRFAPAELGLNSGVLGAALFAWRKQGPRHPR